MSLAGAVVLASTVMMGAGAPPEEEPDDRLPPQTRELAAGLVRRGMPELVEALLAGHPPMHRVHVARACVRAGVEAAEPSLRERLFSRAADEYRRLIDLGQDADWLIGERRRFDVAQWRIEFADMILRHWIAPDLDRFEITSGLAFDRDRLKARLEEARRVYAAAEAGLKDLDIGVRTDEERYLLLGIADRITLLSAQRELNSAWAVLYLALIGEPDDSGRQRLLDDALGGFDRIAGAARDEARKYNALLGAGIALRESGRGQEAVAAFERILRSTAPRALAARARYEMARALLRERRFDAARAELDRLALMPPRRFGEGDSGALFYIRLAPLIHAYSYIAEIRSAALPPSRRAELEDRARSELVDVAEEGAAWGKIVQVYLDALAGRKREPGQFTDTELALSAGERMADGDFEGAARAWQILLGRESAAARHAEARFNLGVCSFQRRRLREAAEAFLSVARDAPPAALADRACAYAYRSWRQLAAETRKPEDYLRLAEAAILLAETRPDHEDAPEARWVAALALEEAGEYRRALARYAKVPSDSPRSWHARRNAARCRQRLYESLSETAPARRRERHARNAVEGWLALAEELASSGGAGKPAATGPAARKAAPPKDTRPDRETRRAWIEQARLAAAALLAGDDLRDYEACIRLLDQLPANARVLGLHIRCLQGLGEIKEANRVLEDFLKQGAGGEMGPVLVGLAAEMESEIKRLRRIGRRRDARRMAAETLPTIRHLLEWIRCRPEHRAHVPVVQYSLARTLIQADRREEAAQLLDALMAEHPANGVYVRAAALLQEDIASSRAGGAREAAWDRAEALWARLLKDPSLRERAPEEYWEARYRWLKHQLRHGRAREVFAGIRSEQAWRPDLGGPPWQGRLLNLKEQARERIEAAAP